MMMFDSKPRQILYTVIILSADNGLYDCLLGVTVSFFSFLFLYTYRT